MRDRRSRAARDSATFNPRSVPEVAAGYLWDPGLVTGLATSGFTLPEMNGHTAFNGLQSNTALQPAALSLNGQSLFRMPNTASAFLAMSAAAAAGWTGATGVMGWYRLPDANGDITGTSTLFAHNTSAGNQRRLIILLSATADRLQIQTCTNSGTSFLITEFANPFVGGAFHWIEAFFDPLFVLGGSLATERVKLFVDFVQQTPVTTVSAGTALFDGIANATITSTASGKDRLDWGRIHYTNGIASLPHRVRCANACNPTGTLLAA